MKPISSRDNPQLKRLRALAQDARARREQGATVLDGAHLVTAALDAGRELTLIAFAEGALARPEFAALAARLPPQRCLLLPDALLAAASPVDHPSGVLAEMPLPPASQAQVGEGDLLVLEAVQDPGNLGTLLRTAAAVGLRRVWLSPGCAQAWAPRVLRAGMGAHFLLDLSEQVDFLPQLASYPGQILATGLVPGATSVFDTDLRSPTAWLFGAEGQGLGASALACAHRVLTLPMPGGTESLNVAVAAGVCLYEQLRQRAAA